MSDWGKGVNNNSNGWGQGAINNSNDWGNAHATSWSGDTEIFGFDSAAVAAFDEIEAQGGTLSATVKSEYSAFVKREKDAGRYSKILLLYAFLGGTIDSARVDLINLVQATNNNFVDADADASCGLTSDGVAKSLQTPTLSSLVGSETEIYIAQFVSTVITSSSYYCGLTSSTSNERLYIRDDGSNVDGWNLGAIMSGSGRPLAPASISVLRPSEDNGTSFLRFNQTTNATDSTSVGSTSNSLITLFAVTNVDGTTPAAHGSFTSNGWVLAKNFSTSEANAFNVSYKTFLTNIGVI